MKLSALLEILPQAKLLNIDLDNEIEGLSEDSRDIQVGYLFVAIRGQETDGHKYIKQAIKKGAVAVIGQIPNPGIPEKIPYIQIDDPRSNLALLASRFYGLPSQHLRVIGVTGTDGKTTTSILINSILLNHGYKVGVLTTVGALIDGQYIDTGVHVTTPGAVQVQSILAKLVSKGCDYAIIETTSHALDQERVRHCDYDVAVITNITHEHLNYHGTYEAYREAKSKLFHYLYSESYKKKSTPKVSVLNMDDKAFEYLDVIPSDKHLRYSLSAKDGAEFYAENIEHTPSLSTFVAVTPDGSIPVEMSLIGDHNVYNALAAIAACYSQGVSKENIIQGIKAVKNVTARMHKVDYGQKFDLYVDYAHTPNALEQILKLARQLARKGVIIVFGLSGGLRDKSKRSKMGSIAGMLSDKIVITAVDWYKEDVNEIMHDISVGCDDVGKKQGVDYWCIPNRQDGINFAIQMAEPGDIVIVAGKGHENSISIGGIEHPWSEFEAVKSALQTRGNL